MQAKTRAYMDAVISDYLLNDARIVDMLARVHMDAAWALALHIYCRRIRIRGWDWFNNQWTPSNTCIAEARRGPGYTEFERCIQGVTSNFERQTGMALYTLTVNETRTRTQQISAWHANRHTNARGREVLNAVVRRLRRREFPDAPTPESKAAFVQWFVAMDNPEVTNAAPGLSDHGLMQAADFVVKTRRGHRLVAGTSTDPATIDLWEGRVEGFPNFSGALNRSVRQFNTTEREPRFASEHLQNPYEPWHYTYLGQVVDRTLEVCRVGVDAEEEVAAE